MAEHEAASAVQALSQSGPKAEEQPTADQAEGFEPDAEPRAADKTDAHAGKPATDVPTDSETTSKQGGSGDRKNGDSGAKPEAAHEADATIPLQKPAASDSNENPIVAPGPVGVSRSERVASQTAQATAEPKALSSSDTNRVLAQTADRIEMLSAVRPRNGVSIRLEPEHLGIITIKVTGTGREIEAELKATDDSVRAALHAHRSDLAQSLNSRGIAVHALSVASDASQASTYSERGTAQQERQPSQSHYGPRQESSTQAFTLDMVRRVSRSATGVDLWI
jgi:flagellar hook-length control protein FliK